MVSIMGNRYDRKTVSKIVEVAYIKKTRSRFCRSTYFKALALPESVRTSKGVRVAIYHYFSRYTKISYWL